MLLADRRICPSLRYVNNLYEKWLVEKKGASNASAMFDCLKEIVNYYNRNNADKGGKCYLQRVDRNGSAKHDLMWSICTPLRSRVHGTTQPGEMVFMDSSGSIDRHNNPVFFMHTYHPCGVLPLVVWVSWSQSQLCLENQLEKFKCILPSDTFGGRGAQKEPGIFTTDTGRRQALRVHWQQATLLLCIFHFLQATWRWLLDSEHPILKDDKQHLMSIMQDLVFAKTHQEFEEIEPLVLSNIFFVWSAVSWSRCYVDAPTLLNKMAKHQS